MPVYQFYVTEDRSTPLYRPDGRVVIASAGTPEDAFRQAARHVDPAALRAAFCFTGALRCYLPENIETAPAAETREASFARADAPAAPEGRTHAVPPPGPTAPPEPPLSIEEFGRLLRAQFLAPAPEPAAEAPEIDETHIVVDDFIDGVPDRQDEAATAATREELDAAAQAMHSPDGAPQEPRRAATDPVEVILDTVVDRGRTEVPADLAREMQATVDAELTASVRRDAAAAPPADPLTAAARGTFNDAFAELRAAVRHTVGLPPTGEAAPPNAPPAPPQNEQGRGPAEPDAPPVWTVSGRPAGPAPHDSRLDAVLRAVVDCAATVLGLATAVRDLSEEVGTRLGAIERQLRLRHAPEIPWGGFDVLSQHLQRTAERATERVTGRSAPRAGAEAGAQEIRTAADISAAEIAAILRVPDAFTAAVPPGTIAAAERAAYADTHMAATREAVLRAGRTPADAEQQEAARQEIAPHTPDPDAQVGPG